MELLDPSRTLLLLVDIQDSFYRAMKGPERAIGQRLEQILLLAGALDIPTVATFEHPLDTKGGFPEFLEPLFPKHGVKLNKHTFNCCEEPDILKVIHELDPETVVVAGSETDVCVLFSCLGLLDQGYRVQLLEDMVFSSAPDCTPALDRLHSAGVVPSRYKTFFYEMTRTVDRKKWPASWRKGVKAAGRSLLEPEELIPWNRSDAGLA